MSLARECRVFTRYLVAGEPTPYIVSRYQEAHRSRTGLDPATPFERLALGLARRGAWTARLADAHGRLFAPRSALRRKLILLLAILETTPPHYRRIDRPGGAPALTPLRLAAHGLLAVTALALGSLLLLPLQAACRLAGGGGR